uniref:Uncharacterized protein n=1 Tax=Tetranychus urticae TaxID=32264 RepID=T1KF62_TETUR
MLLGTILKIYWEIIHSWKMIKTKTVG